MFSRTLFHIDAVARAVAASACLVMETASMEARPPLMKTLLLPMVKNTIRSGKATITSNSWFFKRKHARRNLTRMWAFDIQHQLNYGQKLDHRSWIVSPVTEGFSHILLSIKSSSHFRSWTS